MPLTTPTGEQFQLSFGDAVATVTEVGAHLREFSVSGREVIVPFAAAELPPACRGAVLAPWPNRIRDGQYTWDGVDYQLPLTEPERDNAIHGLASWQRWTCREHTETTMELSLDLPPTHGYPFVLALATRYELSEAGLRVQTVATNHSTVDAPYGVGFHPWLSPGPGSLDDATLQLDAAHWIPTDDRLLPTGVEPIPPEFDFRQPRPIGATALDDAFINATYDQDGRSWLRLTGTDGRTAAVWMDHSMSCWQMCSGDEVDDPGSRRAGLAAEPMSCVADAFRTGTDVVRLAPGESHAVTWGLALL